MFGLSLFRPSQQSKISTLGEERFKYPLPWENKISQIPTPCTPPPPTSFTLIGVLLDTYIQESEGSRFFVFSVSLEEKK